MRAILAVAARHREVRILLPMVLGPGDFGAALAVIEDLARREGWRERPKIGAMIESPAAVLTIGEILELADFASLGTNDLTQFMLAAPDLPACTFRLRLQSPQAAGAPTDEGINQGW